MVLGRYHGISGQIGSDGLWKSPADFFSVAEVKTTEVYAIRNADLVGYVDALTSEKRIRNWDYVSGLFIVGRPDAELHQTQGIKHCLTL